MIPATMCGVYLTRHGGPDALEWREDIPVPHPGPGDGVLHAVDVDRCEGGGLRAGPGRRRNEDQPHAPFPDDSTGTDP